MAPRTLWRRQRRAALSVVVLILMPVIVGIVRSYAGPRSSYTECKEVAFEATFLREKNKVEVVGKACLHNGRWRLVEAEE
jgi:hypothetical protein